MDRIHVRQSDRLLEFSAKTRARKASSPARNAATALPHIRALASIRSSFCRIERQNSSAASAYAATSRPEFPILADIVAKVFLGWRTKILRAADALYARQLEGPYRFIQNRSRASAVALKSDAAAEKSKDQLSRDFPGRSIFDFCNNICQ